MPLFDMNTMLKRIDKAKKDKAQWKSHLQECYKYAMPERDTMDEHSQGQKKRNGLYDDTAVEALDRFASRTQSQITPSMSKWCVFKAGSEVPEQDKERLEAYLDQATDVLFEHIDHSNFATQVNESYQDVGISTGCIIVEEGDGINSHLNFRSVSLSEIIVEKTSKSNLGNVWREFKIPIRDIESIWAKAKLSDKLKKIMSKDINAEATIIEGVVYDEKKRKYVSMLIHPEFKEVLHEELSDTSPFIVFREGAISGETLGRGRIMRKLVTIKVLNKLVELHLKGLVKSISGTYTALNDGIINPDTISFEGGSIITVGSNDMNNPTLRPLDTVGNPQLAEAVINKLQYSIKNYMLAEPFGQIEETPVRSATEMNIRDAESKEMRAASFARIQSEFLEPLVTRCVDILKQNGKIADFKIDGKEVKLKFTSPASKQRDKEEVEKMVESAQYLQMLVPPEILQQKIKMDEIPDMVFDLMGLPKSLIRTEEEMEQLAQQQQQQMMAMQQMQAQGVGMEEQAKQEAVSE